jgi:hypothetical protein
MDNILPPVSHAYDRRVVSEGARPGSTSSPWRRTVDGSSIERISDVIRRKPVPATSVNPFLGQNGSKDRRPRMSIDGAALESISDNFEHGKSSARWSVSPSLTPLSEISSPRSISSNGPQRSKFTNHSRKPPSTLAVPKRRSRVPSPHFNVDISVEPLHVNSPKPSIRIRPSHTQLPRLTIPEKERPAVELIRIEKLDPILGNEMDSPASLGAGSKYVTPQAACPSLYLTLHNSQVHEKQRDYNASLPTITSELMAYLDTFQDSSISPYVTTPSPKLGHNIRFTSLDLPDLSITSYPDISPILSETDQNSPISSRKSSPITTGSPNSKGQNMGLFNAIFQILRSPSSARSPTSSRSSASPQSILSPWEPPNLKRHISTRAAQSISKKPCNICNEHFHMLGMLNRPTPRCKHLYSTCKACVVEWVKSSIKNGELFRIRCPHDTCSEELSYDDIKAIVPRDVFEK